MFLMSKHTMRVKDLVVLVVEVPAAMLALSDMAAEEKGTGSSKPRL
jgi:hypothetical protein